MGRWHTWYLLHEGQHWCHPREHEHLRWSPDLSMHQHPQVEATPQARCAYSAQEASRQACRFLRARLHFHSAPRDCYHHCHCFRHCLYVSLSKSPVCTLTKLKSTSTPLSGTATSTSYTLASTTVTTTTSVPTTVYSIVSVTTCPTASPTI
jgi:hypothetical protein